MPSMTPGEAVIYEAILRIEVESRKTLTLWFEVGSKVLSLLNVLGPVLHRGCLLMVALMFLCSLTVFTFWIRMLLR